MQNFLRELINFDKILRVFKGADHA